MAGRETKKATRGRPSSRNRKQEEEYPWDDPGWDEPRWTDLARKLVRGGAEVIVTTQDAIRERTGEMKAKEMPKEFVESVAHLTARTKDELVGLMAREFKNYLDKLDVASELRSIIEQYTLDVNMTIRLRPNEAFGPGDVEDADEGDESLGDEGTPVADEADGAEVEAEVETVVPEQKEENEGTGKGTGKGTGTGKGRKKGKGGKE